MPRSEFLSPSRLTAAREFRGFTRKQLAESIGVRPMTVSGYEKGDWQPSLQVLQEIAEILGFPIEWFFQDEIDLVDSQGPTFRAQSRMTAKTRNQALRTWDLAALLSQQLRRKYNLPPVEVPNLSQEDPEVAAKLLRAEWGLGLEPIGNVIHLLESRGVFVFWTDIPSPCLDACCHWSEGQPVVLLNTLERSGERLRFNAAHELGHLVLHRDDQTSIFQDRDEGEKGSPMEDEEDSGEPTKREALMKREREAHRFASAFLLPARAWQLEGPSETQLRAFLNLKSRWGVSMQAMIRRSFDLEMISEWQYENLMTQISMNGLRKAEPKSLAPESSLLHSKLAALWASKSQSLDDFAKEMAFPVDVLHSLMPSLPSKQRQRQEKDIPRRPTLRLT